MSTRKTTAEKIEAARIELKQKENELKRLEQIQKDADRKARNHRISKRGAHLESLLPDTIMLSDARFFTFLEKTVANDYGRRALAVLVAEQTAENAKNADGSATDGEKTTAKPAPPTATPDATNASRTENGARQAG